MFNNSSDPWIPTETSAVEFRNLVSCYKWHLQNNVSLEQVHEACSMYEDLVRLGTETDVVFWLMGLLILIGNFAVLLGIIGTRELQRPVYIYLANLAITDVFAGIGLLYRTVGHIGHDQSDDEKREGLNRQLQGDPRHQDLGKTRHKSRLKEI
ncbi:Gamma-tubulin complex component 5 [Branchiostoma belcheri]|nr:Gamma-tubulin complex component 5 [Branchiostoma belcheri]